MSSVSVAVVIVLFLFWIYYTYDQQTMLLWLAILIAATTAVINMWSLNKTRQSLDLTRKSLDLTTQSTRPYLSFINVRYLYISPDKSLLLLAIQNTGLLPAYQFGIEYNLTLDSKFVHGNKKEPALKPHESREIGITLPPYIREIIPTENTHLTIYTETHVSKKYFYHDERHYSMPQGIKTFDQSFDFVFRKGGDFD